MEEAIVSRLREVGFSLYEARVYLALLREGSQNGNEVAKRAAVPSSKVYAALTSSRPPASSSRYGAELDAWAALPPDELVTRLRRHYNEPLDFLVEELPKVRATEPSEPFLTISGLAPTHEAAAALIGSAREVLNISCWEADLDALREPLVAADARGVRAFGMLYGEQDPPPGSWMRHPYEDIVAHRVGGRLLALVADDREALIARMPDEGEANAVRSRNPVMTLIVKEYLHHDSVLQRAALNFGAEEWDRWWRADPDARGRSSGARSRRRTPARRQSRRSPTTSVVGRA